MHTLQLKVFFTDTLVDSNSPSTHTESYYKAGPLKRETDLTVLVLALAFTNLTKSFNISGAFDWKIFRVLPSFEVWGILLESFKSNDIDGFICS